MSQLIMVFLLIVALWMEATALEAATDPAMYDNAQAAVNARGYTEWTGDD